MSALGQKRTLAVQDAMSALGHADIGPTSDEHSDVWQDNRHLGELARVRIIGVQRTWPLLETTRGLDRVVIGAIAAARERP